MPGSGAKARQGYRLRTRGIASQRQHAPPVCITTVVLRRAWVHPPASPRRPPTLRPARETRSLYTTKHRLFGWWPPRPCVCLTFFQHTPAPPLLTALKRDCSTPPEARSSGAMPALRCCHALTLSGLLRRTAEVVCPAAKPIWRATAHARRPLCGPPALRHAITRATPSNARTYIS